MSARLHITGDWPGSVSIRRGWGRAVARPWNDEYPHGSLRLIRGGRDFLAEAAADLALLSGGNVFSPALYHSAAEIWKRAGFELNTSLDVMERTLPAENVEPSATVNRLASTNLAELGPVEEAAFEPFWRMSELGLREALKATPKAVTMVTQDTTGFITGYAITGAQMSVSFLQRIAVSKNHAGAGLGTALVMASFDWARKQGARTMILNVRAENAAARRLYEKNGFATTETALELLEFKG